VATGSEATSRPFGRVLHVDLGTRSTRTENLDETIVRSYIGGSGIGTCLLARNVPPDADPLGSRNVLVTADEQIPGRLVLRARGEGGGQK
jgi:aldehyde:ferredoxin oxidoreductase